MGKEQDRQKEMEAWDGHNVDDNCPWEKEDSSPLYYLGISLVPVIREWRALQSTIEGLDASIVETLRDYRDTQQGHPIKTLNKGEEFRLDSHPKGTIIHFAASSEFRESSRHEQIEYEDEWALLTQVKYGTDYTDVLIGYSNYQLDETYLPSKPEHWWVDSIEVGKVYHSKFIDADAGPLGIRALLRLNRMQSLERFKWIEVWKFGQEVRQRGNIGVTVPLRGIVNRPTSA